MSNRLTHSDFYRSTTTQEPSQTTPKPYVSHLHVDPIHSGYDAADLHQEQRRHYGADMHQRGQRPLDPREHAFRSSEWDAFAARPRPPPPACDADLAAANAKATRRKPVPPPPSSLSPSYDPKIGPQPPSHKRSVSAEAIGLKAPLAATEPAAPGASKYINTRRDGRFDPRSIHRGEAEEAARRPPPPSSFAPGEPRHPRGPPPSSFAPGEAKPGASRSGPPPSSFGGDAAPRAPPTTFAAMPFPPETTHAGAPPSPTSEHDERPPLHRSSSTRSLRAGIKTLGERLRRGSTELMHNLSRATSLAGRPPADRSKDGAAKADAARESACRADPALRPAWEREQQRRKNFARGERGRAGATRGSREKNPYAFDADESALVGDAERRARQEERNAPYTTAARREHDDSDGASGRSTSPTPSLRSSVSLTASERAASRAEAGQPGRGVGPALDRWEKLGMALGAMVDAARRKGSDQSDFFGDAAPGGAMERCECCGEEPAGGALRFGLCGRCEWELRREGLRRR